MTRVCSTGANDLFGSSCKVKCTGNCPRVFNSIALPQSLPTGHLGIKSDEKAVSRLVSALKQCSETLDLDAGKKLHRDALAASVHKNKYVAAVLIKMYSKCRRMELAERVFQELSHRDIVIWTTLIQGYVENGNHLAALEAFDSLNCEPNSVTFVAALKACGSLATRNEAQREIYLQRGIEIHKQLQNHGLESNLMVATSLLNMYCKFGKTELAQELFNKMSNRSVVTWSTLIHGYAENGKGLNALELFDKMDCKPDTYACVAALKACVSLANEKEMNKQYCLEKGIAVHKQARDSGVDRGLILGNALIDMYRKCGSIPQAREVFDSMCHRNVVTWTCMIQGYVADGKYSEALELFQRMNCEPNSFTYVVALRACGLLAAEESSERKPCLEKGRNIHKQLKARGLDSDILVASNLVDMYCKCRCLEEAKQVFDAMKDRSIFTWNTLVLGYVENGNSAEALEILSSLECEADGHTYVAGLKACSKLASEKASERSFCFEKGISIHRRVKQQRFDWDVVVISALIDMYSKCGRMQHARAVFDTAAQRNVFTWTSLIQGYAENGEPFEALEMLSAMDCEPNCFTFVAGLKACGALALDDKKRIGLEKAVALHDQVRKRGIDSDVVVVNALIDVYSRCGSTQRARKAFEGMIKKNVISWTSLIAGLVANGESLAALNLFSIMDCEPNTFTYAAALKACSTLASSEEKLEKNQCLEKGVAIHEQIKKEGLRSVYFMSTALLDMYCKCGSMKHAKEIFDGITQPDVVAWTTLIQGYVENGEGMVAMDTFIRMDCEADTFTYVAALRACSSLASLTLGRRIHARVCKRGIEQDRMVASSLIDFYAKCGNMSRAQELFNSLRSPDIFSWNSLISGYSSLGLSSQVFDLGNIMQESGVEADDITILCILTACSHSGLVDRGQEYFNHILRFSSERLSVKHYRCMVDMLGRANRLQEALALVKNMPFEADVITWTTLLDACRKWKNLELGKLAFDELAALKTKNAAAYVLMSEIYGA